MLELYLQTIILTAGVISGIIVSLGGLAIAGLIVKLFRRK